MPVYKWLTSDIREVHTAERLQLFFKESGEDVSKMKPEVIFEKQIQKISGDSTINLGDATTDGTRLTLDPSTDEDLRLAFEIIQLKIGELRHAQLHAPPPEPEPDPLVEG